MALLPTTAMADDITGTTEVDVIFPRNGTYAPTQLLPVVFAVRNPPIASQLQPKLAYTIYQLDSPNSNITYKPMTENELNLPSNDSTYFWYKGEPSRFLEEGRYVFQWGFRYTNCSETDDPEFQDTPYTELTREEVLDGFHLGTALFVRHLVFTIGEDGAQVDLPALTGPDGCNGSQGLAYNVDSQLDIPRQLQKGGVTQCAKFAAAPTPSPCLVSVEADAASSISAALTATQCGGPSPSISCPPEEDGGGHFRVSYSLCGSVLSGWLLYTLLF
jgi:hypothetical protein